MCGRFVSASPPDELARYFGAQPPDRRLEPSFNVAPTTEVYAVRARAGHRHLVTLRWGLVPFWAKDPKVGSRMINARAESVLDKPAYRQAMSRRRCLIPADGFYEWAKVPGHAKKQPYFIHRADGEPVVFAGLWERWRPPDDGADESGDRGVADGGDVLETCVILTCGPNETMATIHDRMPVLLAPSDWDAWLADTDEPARLAALLRPAPDGLLSLRAVGPAVNNVRNNRAELLEPDPHPLEPAGE
ncbi:MAG: SOS response-associated peptidase [Acidimicrobiales bacterium]